MALWVTPVAVLRGKMTVASVLQLIRDKLPLDFTLTSFCAQRVGATEQRPREAFLILFCVLRQGLYIALSVLELAV